jgi:putative transposase
LQAGWGMCQHTRRVEGLVKTLGIERLSKSQVSEMAKSLDVMVADFRN